MFSAFLLSSSISSSLHIIIHYRTSRWTIDCDCATIFGVVSMSGQRWHKYKLGNLDIETSSKCLIEQINSKLCKFGKIFSNSLPQKKYWILPGSVLSQAELSVRTALSQADLSVRTALSVKLKGGLTGLPVSICFSQLGHASLLLSYLKIYKQFSLDKMLQAPLSEEN